MHELADRFLSPLDVTWRYRWFAVVIAWIIALGEGTLGDQRKDSEAARYFIDKQLNSYNKKFVATENVLTVSRV